METKFRILCLIAVAGLGLSTYNFSRENISPDPSNNIVDEELLSDSSNSIDMEISSDFKGFESKAFGDLMVEHAKRLCRGDFYKSFSQDGRDFVSFWKTASDENLDPERAFTCMRLFYKNLKSCELIDSTVVEYVLSTLPTHITKYVNKKEENKEVGIVREDIESLFLDKFANNADRFQSKPHVFLEELSHDVMNKVKSNLTFMRKVDEDVEYKSEFEDVSLRVVDVMLDKLIWYDSSYQSIWPSFVSIGDELHNLGIKGIIKKQDRLDEYWDALLTRFQWFLDFRGSSLPLDFYLQAEEDLKNNVVFFLEAEEQDEGIIPKKDRLIKSLVKAKAKSISQEQKMVSSDQRINL